MPRTDASDHAIGAVLEQFVGLEGVLTVREGFEAWSDSSGDVHVA